ncbi:addiction module protein [Corallococcus terminator]
MATKDELLTLDEEPAQEDSDSGWSQELERRATDIREGRVETVPWEDVERQVAARLK